MTKPPSKKGIKIQQIKPKIRQNALTTCAHARMRGHDCWKRVAGDKLLRVCVCACVSVSWCEWVSWARQTDRCHWPFSLWWHKKKTTTHTQPHIQSNHFVCTFFFSCVCFSPSLSRTAGFVCFLLLFFLLLLLLLLLLMLWTAWPWT